MNLTTREMTHERSTVSTSSRIHERRNGPLYCSDSAPVEGVLSFFPQLRQLVDIHYLEFPRPREPLVKALGDQYQSIPVLILAANRKLKDEELHRATRTAEGFSPTRAAFATICRPSTICRKRANNASVRA